MRVNVDKVLERDQKLSELDDRADALQAGASQFETSAAKLKNKYWWKNAKVNITQSALSKTENGNVFHDNTSKSSKQLTVNLISVYCFEMRALYNIYFKIIFK